MARWNQRLKKAREKMKLSLQGAVSLLYQQHKIRMDRANLRKFESSKIDMPVSKFRALCNIYLTDANWILDLKQEKK